MSNTQSSERSVLEQCAVLISHLDVISQRHSNVLLESGLVYDLEGIALDLKLWRAEVFDFQEQDFSLSQELAAFMLEQFAMAVEVLEDIENLMVPSSADPSDTEDQEESAETLHQPTTEALHGREPLAIAVRDLQQTARNITDLTDTIRRSRIAVSGQQQSNVKVVEATKKEINKNAIGQTSELFNQALTSTANLAVTYSDQWSWEEAGERETKAIRLQAAKAGGYPEIAKLLLEENADVDSQGDLEELSFVKRNELPIYATRLSEVTVSFTTERRTQPSRCELRLFRSFEQNIADRTLTLILRCGDTNRRMVIPLCASAHTLAFVPISHFDPSATIADAKGAESGIQCRVNGLHGHTTFHFPHAREYRLFQTLLTYQRPCLTLNLRGTGIKFDSISVRYPRQFSLLTRRYGAGHAQVLYQLSDKEYQDWVLDEASAASVTPSGSISQPTRPYRLALYTTSLEGHPERKCIVYYLDHQGCVSSLNPQSDDRKITFRRRGFCTAIFEAPRDTSQDSASSYPGYPVSPDLLGRATVDRSKYEAMSMVEVELTMSTAQDCKDLMEIIKRFIIDTP